MSKTKLDIGDTIEFLKLAYETWVLRRDVLN